MTQDKTLSGLIQRANQLKKLDDQLQMCLPSQVKGLCHLANIKGETAVFVCYTQMEASKIRMYSRSILQIMQTEFKISVKKLQLKVELKR
ncbi:DciA family protein [Marinicella litoralis]|nr:DciA family protein [Marinicella litoralis]